MIRSMTGFGRASFSVAPLAFAVELRTVNHRHLDVSVRLPKSLSAFEPDVRARLREGFARGKVECSVQARSGSASAGGVELDRAVAAGYARAAAELAEAHSLAPGLDAARLLGLPGVTRLAEAELPEEALGAALAEAVDEAAAAADAMRRAEGEALERDLRGRLEQVARLAGEIGARAEEVRESVKERLRKRAEQLRRETGLLDEARLHQEVVLAADRLDVNEERVRLESHVEQFRGILDAAEAGAPVGRRLDFLLQEMGREANTLGSKGSDAPVAHRVVDLKTEIERLREQVQNVE